jgi:hypothetical protein
LWVQTPPGKFEVKNMSIDLSSHIGPVIVCKSPGKIYPIDIPDETLYCIGDESESIYFTNNHVYVSNRHGYSINAAPEECGQLVRLNNCKVILEKFKQDFANEIKLISDYYGSDNIEIFIALYSYYS